MPSKTRASVSEPSGEPVDAAPAPDPETYVLLDYTGDTLVVDPYGELRTGDVVAARPSMVPKLLNGGRFAQRTDARPDAEQIRTP